MQPTEIPNTVAEIKQNFPNMPRHSWETTGLPSGGRPFPWKLHLQEADESACSPQADIPNRLKVVNATIQLQRKTIYTPNSDGSKCSFFTSFSTVTGSNGISLLFGLHFSICKFFYIYIGHFYFFFTDCFDMPFAHFSSEIFVFLFICKMQKYLSKSLFLILELWCMG